MFNIPLEEIFTKLPKTELEEEISRFVEPITRMLPEQRLRKVVPLIIQGILGGQTPIVTQMAQSVSRLEVDVWPAAKRIYRFMENERFNYRVLRKGLYRQAQRVVATERLDKLVIAIDPVNMEKPYTKKLEGVSTVYKSTPPPLQGKGRLTRGYPAITATVVNTEVPATSYAQWFSYTTDFISENNEIYHAIRMSHSLFPDKNICFVADSGLDDRKIFAWIANFGRDFIIRAQHLERNVEVYNQRLDRWEEEKLEDLMSCMPCENRFQVVFNHARKMTLATLGLDWFKFRLPDTHQVLWAIVIENSLFDKPLVLLTNIPVLNGKIAQQLYVDWRLRSRIEDGYRFDQEQGLDIEKIQVRSLERMRRLFILVLLAAQFVFHLNSSWPAEAILWLRKLGGKLGLSSDLDGPYILLRGLRAVYQTIATLSFLAIHPFPKEVFRCG